MRIIEPKIEMAIKLSSNKIKNLKRFGKAVIIKSHFRFIPPERPLRVLNEEGGFEGYLKINELKIKLFSELDDRDAKYCGLESKEKLISEIKKNIKISLSSITFINVEFKENS